MSKLDMYWPALFSYIFPCSCRNFQVQSSNIFYVIFVLQLPLEVENVSSNSLTVFPLLDFDDLNCQGSPFDDDPLSDGSQYQPCSESWDDFQSLSPFGADWEMEQEFFKSDFNDFECKTQGPTLAELNNQRSTSPLINPEMERLHRIATRTDVDDLRSTGSYSDIKIRVESPEMLDKNKENVFSSSTRSDSTNRYDEESYQKRLNDEESLPSKRGHESFLDRNVTSTCTVKQEPRETIELKHSDLMKRIAYLEAKSNNQTLPEESPSTVGKYSESESRDDDNRTVGESTSEDEQLAVIQEESADEDLDSEDDFEDSHSKDFEIPAKQRKGRRGDMEDMNPNPRKLLEISRELNRLTKIITDLKPIHSLPMTARNKSKKEKNKLASRACRLKKKAQHESNKLKIHGLELEHKRLISLIEEVKAEMIRDTQGYTVSGELSNKVENLIHNSVGNQIVAGHTTAFVESILKATANTTPGFKGMDILLNI
ncbi:hypothetical protein QZH41_009101 [Actinostola sp. cb2023]|nr:hypothetical protein QZH41_009101 [Actinostola sp. cb2023]